MTTGQTFQFVLTAVQFTSVVIGGTFAACLATRWLQNKREERANSVREAEQRASARFDRERESWLAILGEKDRELENMNAMLSRLQKNYDIATKVLSAVDKEKGEEAA